MEKPIHLSSIGQKKENFRKQIRKQKINQQLASRRKMLFRDTLALIRPQKDQFVQLNSWEQVKQQLTAFMPDYCAIHIYISTNHNNENRMPEDIEKSLVSLVHRPEFLTDQDSLAFLVTLTLIKNKNGKPIFESGAIKLIVDNLLKWSIVEAEIDGIMHQGVNYFETVCWTLYSFASICENEKQQVFETFRQKIQVFEQFSSELCYQQIMLFTYFSTFPSFLPSTKFIQRIIRKSLELQSQKQNTTRSVVVCLLDNFMRQKQQNRLRFEVEENKELTSLYFEFIYTNLEDSSFSKARRVELIALLTTLINSGNESTMHTIFVSDKAMKLFSLIFNSALYEIWDIKKVSLECITAIMMNHILLPYLSERISPNDLAHLCYESLNLPDHEIKKLVVSAVLCLCCLNAKAFVKEFRKYNMAAVIKRIQYEEINSKSTGEQQIRLSEYVTHMDEYVKFFEANLNEHGQEDWKRSVCSGEKDLEI